MELYIKKVETDNEWFHYHRITKAKLLLRNPDIIYDPNHASIKDARNNTYVLYYGTKIIGVLMIQAFDANLAVLRLLAIDQSAQKMGYGSQLLKLAENLIKQSGYKKILLHANPKAESFYCKHGYQSMDFSFDSSPVFMDSIDLGKLL